MEEVLRQYEEGLITFGEYLMWLALEKQDEEIAGLAIRVRDKEDKDFLSHCVYLQFCEPSRFLNIHKPYPF